MAKKNKESLQLETKMGPAFQFVHLMGMQTKSDVYVAKSRVEALVQLLVETGLIDEGELSKLEAVSREHESERMKSHALVQIADSADKYQIEPDEDLDCSARLHLCKARCCTYDVTLSPQDLDEGRLKWDYARPYRIPHHEGYCVYSCRGQGGGCAEYKARPAACRRYDCRNDDRIWLDFDARIPAPMSESVEDPRT